MDAVIGNHCGNNAGWNFLRQAAFKQYRYLTLPHRGHCGQLHQWNRIAKMQYRTLTSSIATVTIQNIANMVKLNWRNVIWL